MDKEPVKKNQKKRDPRVEKALRLIGKSLTKLRKDAGYTNYESYANARNINRSQYGKYESGKANMSISSLLEQVFLHGLDIEDVLNPAFLNISNPENPIIQKSMAHLIDQVADQVRSYAKANFDDADMFRIHQILILCEKKVSKKEILKKVGLSSKTPNFEKIFQWLIANGLIAMTKPDKPNAHDQKYLTTEAGRRILNFANIS